jgi:putative hydrolase of the HAD superfamily
MAMCVSARSGVTSLIRCIVFDAVGTLIHPEPGVGQAYAKVGKRHGSRRSIDELRQRFRTAFERQEQIDRAAAWKTDEDRELRRWRDIVTEAIDDVADPEACFAELYEHFAQPSAWRCDPDTEMVLTELRRRGMVTAMASNFDHRLHRVTAGLPELRTLKAVIVSSEVGWRKPAAEFFQAMTRPLELDLTAILYIGDDRKNDYEGALAAGLSAMLLDVKGHGPRLGSLRDLLDALPKP